MSYDTLSQYEYFYDGIRIKKEFYVQEETFKFDGKTLKFKPLKILDVWCFYQKILQPFIYKYQRMVKIRLSLKFQKNYTHEWDEKSEMNCLKKFFETSSLVFDIKRIYQGSFKKIGWLSKCVVKICVPRQLPLARSLHDMNFIAIFGDDWDIRHKSAWLERRNFNRHFDLTHNSYTFERQKEKIKNHLYSEWCSRRSKVK